MRSRWSEHSEDATPPPSPEEREADLERARVEVAARALARGHDISRPRPGDGRCLRHAIRGCRCGEAASTALGASWRSDWSGEHG